MDLEYIHILGDKEERRQHELQITHRERTPDSMNYLGGEHNWEKRRKELQIPQHEHHERTPDSMNTSRERKNLWKICTWYIVQMG